MLSLKRDANHYMNIDKIVQNNEYAYSPGTLCIILCGEYYGCMGRIISNKGNKATVVVMNLPDKIT